jgi:hypothetical protein
MAKLSPAGLCPGCLFGGALGLEGTQTLDLPGLMDPSEASFLAQSNAREAGAPDPLEGTRIGRYKILQRIGEGGFGWVYMAEQGTRDGELGTGN